MIKRVSTMITTIHRLCIKNPLSQKSWSYLKISYLQQQLSIVALFLTMTLFHTQIFSVKTYIVQSILLKSPYRQIYRLNVVCTAGGPCGPLLSRNNYYDHSWKVGMESVCILYKMMILTILGV